MAQYRKEALTTNHYYHIYSRSIAKFVVLNDREEYERFYQLVGVYRHVNFNYRYSQFLKYTEASQREILDSIALQNNRLVDIVAYCLMPTHIHLLLKQTQDNGITRFMARLLNGYSRYFNIKHKRTGPLWSGRFKSVLVSRDEQLLHLTRYIHLNPTSADLVKEPSQWPYSSYEEYVNNHGIEQLCRFRDIIDITPKDYKKFIRDRKNYQRELAQIKHLIIDNYTG
jgi:putative transposase